MRTEIDIQTGEVTEIDEDAKQFPLSLGRRRVPKSTIVKRLNEAGKLAAARAALDANLYLNELWSALGQAGPYADDPDTIGLLAAIGADPDVILAE